MDGNKDKVIRVRVTQEMREIVYEKSKKLGVNVSEYLRMLVEKDDK